MIDRGFEKARQLPENNTAARQLAIQEARRKLEEAGV
ncbi:MAG: hypothetical protein ACD_38C00161G0005 [uncultured bacterium]|uniref:Uncharacterized protein n=1 Tax=Candidatus Daviesbacteria bacterium GW2011_GWC2_40_12 TaxID=1618431 RepID=A0A0G0QNX5_9BACT|nr:MAG: hypothetical protein ACD_38C00161G0005 [uncultured bacterium]KKR17020.1 MAG: hypothetical protein UT45_C0003G0050 [Candidatus Daviesbacteria bacterium GW2011_GWA2_39_33]KKR42084.1 MAG: hypothetical protein UT77_C0004G0068 [Candidatus Daviesbacteria bacterium GW2011_GWC2_40_12]